MCCRCLLRRALTQDTPKAVPPDSKPEKMSINIAFVLGNDGAEVEFFKEV